MTAAFILTLDVADVTPESLRSEADFVLDTLVQNGVAVVSVEPWARPSAASLSPSLLDIATSLPQTLLASPLADAADTLP